MLERHARICICAFACWTRRSTQPEDARRPGSSNLRRKAEYLLEGLARDPLQTPTLATERWSLKTRRGSIASAASRPPPKAPMTPPEVTSLAEK